VDGHCLSDIDELYRILDQLAARLRGPRHLRDCTGSSGCPLRGVYGAGSGSTADS
jgi:hypothetical protein